MKLNAEPKIVAGLIYHIFHEKGSCSLAKQWPSGNRSDKWAATGKVLIKQHEVQIEYYLHSNMAMGEKITVMRVADLAKIPISNPGFRRRLNI